MAKSAPTYYIFHGEDDFTCSAEVRQMKARMGSGAEAELNTLVFDGEKVTVQDILSDAGTMPFLSDKRLIIVKGMLTWLTRKGAGKEAKEQLDRLVKALPDLPDYARLLFVERVRLSESHPMLQAIRTDPRGYQKVFGLPFPKEMPAWITRRALSYDAQIEPRASTLLADLVGNDLYAADAELAKLAAYVNRERPISDEDVSLLTVNLVESKMWDIPDLIGAKRGRASMTMLHKLLDEGAEPIAILGMIASQFRKLLMVKAYTEEHINGDLAQLMGVKDFQLNRLTAQARNFSLAELESIHRLLLDTDWKIKTGQFGTSQTGGILALDLLITTLSP